MSVHPANKPSIPSIKLVKFIIAVIEIIKKKTKLNLKKIQL